MGHTRTHTLWQDAGTTLRAESELVVIGGGQKAAGDKELAELLDMWVGFQRRSIKVRSYPPLSRLMLLLLPA